jgi:hypothetical protein
MMSKDTAKKVKNGLAYIRRPPRIRSNVGWKPANVGCKPAAIVTVNRKPRVKLKSI